MPGTGFIDLTARRLESEIWGGGRGSGHENAHEMRSATMAQQDLSSSGRTTGTDGTTTNRAHVPASTRTWAVEGGIGGGKPGEPMAGMSMSIDKAAAAVRDQGILPLVAGHVLILRCSMQRSARRGRYYYQSSAKYRSCTVHCQEAEPPAWLTRCPKLKTKATVACTCGSSHKLGTSNRAELLVRDRENRPYSTLLAPGPETVRRCQSTISIFQMRARECGVIHLVPPYH
jgi:hypothetical protein